MSDKQEITVDFGSDTQRREFVARVVKFANTVRKGVYRFELMRHRPRRSDRQNKYYFPCFVEPFAAWLSEEWGEPVSRDEAHGVLKEKFLKIDKWDHSTGEDLSYVRRSSTLNTVEFNEYLDQCAKFLAETCGFVVPEPSVYREPVEVAA